MKQTMSPSRRLFILLFTTFSLGLFGQNTAHIELQAPQGRYALELGSGQNKLVIKGLIPGNSYHVLLLKATPEQLASLEFLPLAKVDAGYQDLTGAFTGKTKLQFVANSDRMALVVKASSTQKETSIPAFISVVCENCPESLANPKKSMAESLANLSIEENVSAEDLIRNTLIGGDCFEVSNITFSGNALSRGRFSNGGTNIGIDSGMVLSTGRVNTLIGPNLSGSTDGGFDTPGFDSDLGGLVSGAMFDVSIIEFDFTPTANMVQFDFVFGSEEYCEYVGSNYFDAFGFFISGPGIAGVQNLALIPGTNGVPVTTNNVNHLNNSVYYVNNSIELFQCLFLPANHLLECELDGWTTPLTATASVTPCSTYHIKMAIADIGDDLYESAVFLRANSFNAGAGVLATADYQPNLNTAYEGCAQGNIRFTRGNNDLSQPATVDFMVSGASTATAGLDYEALVSPVIIPAGQSELLVPVNVFVDGLTEGQENIILLIDNACQCQQVEVEFLINDNEAFSATIVQDTSICEGFSAFLAVTLEDGIAPFSFEWSTGDTSPTLIVTPLSSTAYSVTVTDACGETATDEALIRVIPIIRDTSELTLCAGSSVTIHNIVYTSSTIVRDTTYEFEACGEIFNYFLTFTDPAVGSETISFCPGTSIEIGGELYTTSGTVVDTLQTTLACDSIVTYTLVLLPSPTRAETIRFCPGETIQLGGNSYTQPGTVELTFPASVGCDTLVTYTLEYLTPAPSNVSLNCPHATTVNVALGATSAVVDFPEAIATSDCPCPDLDVMQSSGLPSGSAFPLGVSTVCYSMQDACGQTASCCLNINVVEESPCDVKEIGCMKYELLTITQDQGKNKTYRIRVTNNCNRPLIYTAIQIPSGIVANFPDNNSVYTDPGGNEYLVRNPNYSPFYSVRYRPLGIGIQNGASSILRYILPAQASVQYINVTSRVNLQEYYQAHLNTFYCPIGVTPLDERRDEPTLGFVEDLGTVLVYPNPTSEDIQVDASLWEGASLRLQIWNSQGQRVLSQTGTATMEPLRVELPKGISDGLYFLEVSNEWGDKEVVKFVVKH